MRILYLGLPLGALCLRADGHRLVGALVGHPQAPGMRRLRRTLGREGSLLLGRPDLQQPEVRELVAGLRPDALLSFFWPQRVPPEVLALPPRGCFGVHPSLLPRWRGPDPYFWTLRAGDPVSGVTLHRLAPDYDTGPVIRRVEVPVPADADAWSLARLLDRPALSLLRQCADRLERGEPLAGQAQDETLATEAPAPTEQDLAIDWHRPADEVLRLVRAAAPEPGATALLDDRYVVVQEARLAPVDPPRALRPAEAWQTPEGLAVKTADRGVLLVRTRPL